MNNYDNDEKQLLEMLIKWGMSEEQAKDALPRIMTWIDLLVSQRVKEKTR